MLTPSCSGGRGRAVLRPRINEAAATSTSRTTTPAAMPPRTATSSVIDESIEIKSFDPVLGCVAVKESLNVTVVGIVVGAVVIVGVAVVVIVNVVDVDVVLVLVVPIAGVVVGAAVVASLHSDAG